MPFMHLCGLRMAKAVGQIHSSCHSKFESFSQDMFGLSSSLHNSEQIKSLYAHILPDLWERGVLQLCGIRSLRRERERERREGERKRQTERERMRGGSLINPRIRGRRFLFLVWIKIKLPLFRSSESFVAPCH